MRGINNNTWGASVAALVAVLILGACGGSDTPDAASPGTTIGGAATVPSAASLPPLTQAPATTKTTPPTTAATPGFYVVKRGDGLGKIAKDLGVKLDALVAINQIKDPNHIEVGQRLIVPPKDYVVPVTTAAATTSVPASVPPTTVKP